MVVFTCQKCNGCLKKNAVDKHAIQSRKCLPFWLTCIDCLKDFKHDEYIKHTSCITEDERYGKKGTQVKPQGLKQNLWMDCVNKFIGDRQNNKELSFLTNVMKDRENIPKNRKKFHNWFLSVNKRVYIQNKVDELFTLLEAEFKSNKESSNKENNQTKQNGKSKESKKNDGTSSNENGDMDKSKTEEENDSLNNSEAKSADQDLKNDEDLPKLSKKELKKKKKMEKYQAELAEIESCPKTEMEVEDAEESKPAKKSKRKHADDSESVPVKTKKRKADQETNDQEEKKPKLDTEPEEVIESPGKFQWSQVIIDVLKSRSDHELSLKRLSKKVIGEYCQRFGDEQDFERLTKKFNKKLKSAQGVVLFKDKAKLEIEES